MVARAQHVALLALLALAPAAAAPSPVDGGTIPVWFVWDEAVLDVVVVPPHHGPLGCLDPCTLASTSVADTGHFESATRAFLQDWLAARDAWVLAHPEDAWLQGFDLRVSWLAEDATLDDLEEADIVLGHWDPAALVLGGAVHPFHSAAAAPAGDAVGERCLALNALTYGGEDLSWADHYNVGAHEFGHCLGLDHTPVSHDVMYGTYEHDIGDGAALHCPSNLDVAGLRLSLGPAMGHSTGEDVASVPLWERYALRPACEG